MHTDPVIHAHQQQDHESESLRLYWRAFDLLQQDFIRSLTRSPQALVGTPYDPFGEQRMVVVLVDDQMQAQRDLSLLEQLLKVLVSAAGAGDRQAQLLIEQMARTHAALYASNMEEAGDLGDGQ